MNKTSKIILGILGSLVLLSGIGAWYVSKVIDSAQLARLLSTSIKSSTGYELKIDGPISLSVFPKIAVRAERLSLRNKSQKQDLEVLTLKNMELDIQTLPLLSGRIEIHNARLNGANVYLQTYASGKPNWGLGDGTSSTTTTDKREAIVPNDSIFISIEKLSLADAKINYRNALGEESHYQVDHLSIVEGVDQSELSLSAVYRDLAIDISGKTGSISQLLKQWGSSAAKFPVDLNIIHQKRVLLLKGNITLDPKMAPVLDIALIAKSFAWPTLGPEPAKSVPAATASSSLVESEPSHKSLPFLFSSNTLPFNSLPKMQGKVSIDIAELVLPGRKPIENLKAGVLLQGNAIDIPRLTFQVGKGTADLRIKMSKLDSAAPTFQLKGVTKELTLEGLLARLDPSSKVIGGNMKLALDMQLSGNSLHQMAANSTGKIQVSIEQAKIGAKFLNDAGDFIITVLDSMNPLRKKSSETVLECAVAYLPINNGQVNITNSVGMETDRLNVVLSGSISLKNEAVNLTIDPKEKSGLTTGLDLAGLVKVGGTLSNPKAKINQAGVVNSAVSIGLGFLTGGASLLAENARSLTSKGHPCRDALHPWSDIYPGAN